MRSSAGKAVRSTVGQASAQAAWRFCQRRRLEHSEARSLSAHPRIELTSASAEMIKDRACGQRWRASVVVCEQVSGCERTKLRSAGLMAARSATPDKVLRATLTT